MSGRVLKTALAEVWYLVVVLVVIALVVVYKLATGGQAAPVEKRVGAAASQGTASGAVAHTVQAPAPRLSEEQKARATIADYQKRFAEDARGKDAPAYLLAMGNLNKQKLRNFKEAARNYELLIKDYPDFEGIAGVYPQLMSCYEQLNDRESLRWLYREMVEKFPPESNEYKYAQAKLNP